ncbi:MAG: hypothetical protein QG639_582 [Patescibacteria group bacterium]|nr:hypothetical protein [Patescibacteria group bacterium]
MNKLTIYYLIIAAIVAGKTLTTIYQRSVVIHHGNMVYDMQNEKKQLLQQKLAMSNELSQKNSLSALHQSTDLSGYNQISQTLVISAPALASSQL